MLMGMDIFKMKIVMMETRRFLQMRLKFCDGVDNDCDGEIDENVTETFFADSDGDGFGTADEQMQSCSGGSGWSVSSGDCDDTEVLVYPSAPELRMVSIMTVMESLMKVCLHSGTKTKMVMAMEILKISSICNAAEGYVEVLVIVMINGVM